MSYKLHCTKKLMDRIKPVIAESGKEQTTRLGNWYATALFWKPQAALFVSERTLLPVLMPLAPAANLAMRFPQQLALVLAAHGVSQDFIDCELAQMQDALHVKTANRSVVGVMNQFSYMADVHRDHFEIGDLIALSLKLSEVPCSPLYKGSISPANELKLVIGGLQGLQH